MELQTESLIHHQAFEKLLHGLILKGQWFAEGGWLEVPVDSISNAFTRLCSKLCPFVMHLQKSGGYFQNSNPLLMMDQKETNMLTDCLELQLNLCSKKNPKQMVVVDLLMYAQSVLLSAVLKDTSLWLDSAEQWIS